MTRYGIPRYIRSDNGSEFIAQKIQTWLRENQIKTRYIDPGSPWQNGYIESFHSRFRDECLNREWSLNLRKARVVIEDWRQHYNEERPHSRLGYLSLEGFFSQPKSLTLSGPKQVSLSTAKVTTAPRLRGRKTPTAIETAWRCSWATTRQKAGPFRNSLIQAGPTIRI